jgi:DNA-binding NtrC family response regulator
MMIKAPLLVLIVDDEKDFVEMLSERFADDGHVVRKAFNAEEGLEALAQQEPDVVVLDIRMPGMDGIAALKKIRAKHPLVEVVLLTGHGSVDTAVEGLKLGAYDYLQKPTKYEDLLKTLEAARDRKAEQEERIRKAEARSLLRRSGDL